MLAKILSASLFGLETVPIDVEVNLYKKGFPGFNIIGLPNKSIDESKERVKTALANSNIEFPQAKIVVNLAPADIPKEGAGFDLPIAIGILASLQGVVIPKNKSMFYGELSLDGTLRHTKGVFLLAMGARQIGVKNLFVPVDSANEGSFIKGINIYPVKDLKQLISHLSKEEQIAKITPKPLKSLLIEENIDCNFDEIIGQNSAKRAMEVSASGGHNIFMQGPPGAGKTMLARALAGVLPPLSENESLEVTKIYSVTGNIPPGESVIIERPYRVSHHTTSRIGLIGGGSNPHPGEISLAHRGVLFLDEFPEFSRGTLEALRQPLEDGKVTITRAAGTAEYPAQFMLVAAANPCPCGYLGDEKHACKCSPRQVMRYQAKLSGPLMDRIDLHVNVPAVDVEKLIPKEGKIVKPESSKVIRGRVIAAREIQKRRFKGTKIHSNGDMRNKDIKNFCKIDPAALVLLKQAVNNYNLSARTYFRLIKVSQTIADLEGVSKILPAHVAEALQYRIRSGD
ncbi:MAG: Mg chelatase-like protein [Candidatus Woesebacteria bacterium GW2011_GWC1_42_9]|nr:MAG: Mg chelatase-like protein [Candidatus Woesebacteria bacterium GW2011_GWC1_42_9]